MKMFGNTPDDLFDAPMREFPWPAKALYWVCLVIVSAFTKLYWHWTCDGNLPYAKPGERTGKVIIANHASMFDPVVLIMISAFRGRRLRPLYKSEFESSSFVNWFFSRVGAIPLKRGSADTKAIRRAVKSLQRGEDVCVFPEGTRIRDPHARAEIHGGFALIAKMAKADVVPVAIEGSHRISPQGKGFPHPARVRIRYGKALSLDEVAGASRRERCDELERVAMARVYAMRAELRGEGQLDAADANGEGAKAAR